MDIKFYKRTTRVGNATAVLIPKAIASMLSKDATYCFVIKEDENGKEASPSDAR